MSQPLVIAHRGFSSRSPENTLASFRAAIEVPVDFIEVDVQETVDGKLAVFHDMQLRRLCGIPGRVSQTTLARMRQCKSDIPTLAEALRAVRGKCRLLIEMKTADGMKIARAIERAGMVEQVIVFSFSIEQLQQVAMTNPEIRLFGLLADDLGPSLRQISSTVHVEGIGVGNRLLKTAAHVHRLQERIGEVFVWTVNQASRMRELASWGVDGIITNRPDVARNLWPVVA
jgi:glycerophosphoryl diester phosphodiesterase